MLIAKVLDKLFNRRNTFEVESLEGDINYNDISLKEVTDWVKSMKSVFDYDEDTGIYTDVPITSDGAIRLGTIMQLYNTTSEEPFFPTLTDQAGKCLVVNDDETGFEYVKKPTLWETDNDFDDLSSELLEQLKVGDLVYSTGEGNSVNVDSVALTFIALVRVTENSISTYNYSKEDDEWSCEYSETPIGGTKLYLHTIYDSTNDYTFLLITTSPTPLNFSVLDDYVKVNTYLNSIIVISFRTDGVELSWDVTFNEFVGVGVVDEDINVIAVNDWDLTNSTDTVTPL